MGFSVVIGADLVPTSSNYEYFINEDMEYLIGTELISVLQNHDFRIFNLETPLTSVESPIEKCGSNLIAPPSTIKAIRAMNPTLLTLANNHILDQGEQGLLSTIETLKECNIPYVGVGKNDVDAARPYILEEEETKVGVYACAEREFSIATEKTPGANGFSQLESLDHIVDLKSECDYVIVLYHGGKEHYRYPSPLLQKCCRKMVEKGADLVICQHSHCVGCFEEYNDSIIIYGQGNFLFDCSDNDYWGSSLLVSIEFGNESRKIDYIPIVKCADKIRLAKDTQAEGILTAFLERSQRILQKDFIEDEFSAYAESMRLTYMSALCGDNPVFKAINRLTQHGALKRMYSGKALLRVLNYIECETHREMLITLLQNRRDRDVKGW